MSNKVMGAKVPTLDEPHFWIVTQKDGFRFPTDDAAEVAAASKVRGTQVRVVPGHLCGECK